MGDATARRVGEWQRASVALAAARRRELRDLTDDEAREHVEQLLDLVDALPRKRAETGLVEQQRLFARVQR